jgi:hypothetical protein
MTIMASEPSATILPALPKNVFGMLSNSSIRFLITRGERCESSGKRQTYESANDRTSDGMGFDLLVDNIDPGSLDLYRPTEDQKRPTGRRGIARVNTRDFESQSQ